MGWGMHVNVLKVGSGEFLWYDKNKKMISSVLAGHD